MVEVLEVPQRSMQQRMDALALANEIRSHRAALKVDLRRRRKDIVAVMDDPRVASMKVIDLIIALPKCGRVKGNRLLVRCRVSPSKTVAGLSPRQRTELVALLAPYRGWST